MIFRKLSYTYTNDFGNTAARRQTDNRPSPSSGEFTNTVDSPRAERRDLTFVLSLYDVDAEPVKGKTTPSPPAQEGHWHTSCFLMARAFAQ